MVDVQETPATPPEEYGGDERAGFVATGVFLVIVGWGVGILLNFLVHAEASAAGQSFGPFWIDPTFGVWAWGTAIVGFFAGLLGSAMLGIGWSMPRGPLVLPGYPYR